MHDAVCVISVLRMVTGRESSTSTLSETSCEKTASRAEASLKYICLPIYTETESVMDKTKGLFDLADILWNNQGFVRHLLTWSQVINLYFIKCTRRPIFLSRITPPEEAQPIRSLPIFTKERIMRTTKFKRQIQLEGVRQYLFLVASGQTNYDSNPTMNLASILRLRR